MKNNKPFDILLDSYSYECFKLYGVIKSLFNYQSIHSDFEGGTTSCKGKLYASAFSIICSGYLVDYTEMYPHEDFELFLEEMQFEEDKEEIIYLAKKANIDNDLPFEELMDDLITFYRKEIVSDIKKVFNNEDLQLRLFGSIFSMGDEEGYEPSFSLDGHPGLYFLK